MNVTATNPLIATLETQIKDIWAKLHQKGIAREECYFHLRPCDHCGSPTWQQPCPFCNYYPTSSADSRASTLEKRNSPVLPLLPYSEYKRKIQGKDGNRNFAAFYLWYEFARNKIPCEAINQAIQEANSLNCPRIEDIWEVIVGSYLLVRSTENHPALSAEQDRFTKTYYHAKIECATTHVWEIVGTYTSPEEAIAAVQRVRQRNLPSHPSEELMKMVLQIGEFVRTQCPDKLPQIQQFISSRQKVFFSAQFNLEFTKLLVQQGAMEASQIKQAEKLLAEAESYLIHWGRSYPQFRDQIQHWEKTGESTQLIDDLMRFRG